MAQSIRPMQIMISIVERGKGKSIMEYYRNHRLYHHVRAFGHGTAASHLLDTLGFGTTERELIFTYGPRDTVRRLMYHLREENRAKLDIQGIAFSLNMTGMSAFLAMSLIKIEELGERLAKEAGAETDAEQTGEERGMQEMEQSGRYSLILVMVNQGCTEEVMDTARAAGARGGTVIRARWTGAEDVEKISGIHLQSEKEVLAIMTRTEKRNRIMEEIDRAHGLKTPSQGTVISLPIDLMARLD